MSLQFAASVSCSVFLETEDDKTSFTDAIVAQLEESEEGV